MEENTTIKPKNVEKFNRLIHDAVQYCYFDISPEERALTIINIKTQNKVDIAGLSKLLDESYSEMFIRLVFAEQLLKMRLKEEYGHTMPGTHTPQ